MKPKNIVITNESSKKPEAVVAKITSKEEEEEVFEIENK